MLPLIIRKSSGKYSQQPILVAMDSGAKNSVVHFGRNRKQDDDDDDFGGGFEMELANMDLDRETITGDGPETQQTCVKWVSDIWHDEYLCWVALYRIILR